MTNEPALPVTATNSGVEAKGTILGLEGKSIVPVLAATIVSVLLLPLLIIGAEGAELWGRLVVALGPVVGTVAHVVAFVHRRPPHYARDWWLGVGYRVAQAAGWGAPIAFSPPAPKRLRGFGN